MGNIELRITWNDWLSVLLIGVIFSAFLSILGYFLLDFSWLQGAVFGTNLGFFITLFSLIFITSMNRFILPYAPKIWWNAIAALFSFSSGFLGSLGTYSLLHFTSVLMIPYFQDHPIQSASIIGVLTYLIGALIYRFVKARNEKESLDFLFIQSRLSSLETQLNPHFLFNALNSLAELIHQNPLKAEEAVLKISTFLRNTMGEKPLISLSEELSNVRGYIDLENIRFNEIITLTIQTDESVLARLIPKFSIQLLVENAIKHGMKSFNSSFNISIRITHSDTLQIRVTNDGDAIVNPAFGIGLSNLQERLTHLCQGKVILEQTNPPTYLIELKECHEPVDCR